MPVKYDIYLFIFLKMFIKFNQFKLIHILILNLIINEVMLSQPLSISKNTYMVALFCIDLK